MDNADFTSSLVKGRSMRASEPGSRGRGQCRQSGLSGVLLAAVLFIIGPGSRLFQEQPSAPARLENQWTGRYGVSAHVILLGNLGDVGSMTIAWASKKSNGCLKKTLRIAGSSRPGQVKKKRDYRGEFNFLKIYPLPTSNSVTEKDVKAEQEIEISSWGFLNLNGKAESEKIAFFPNLAVSVREDGTETRIAGNYGCILSPLEYLLEHEIRVGEVIDTPFILNGIPRVFRMEVEKLTLLSPFQSWAYEISLSAPEKTAGTDRAHQDVWRRKGNLKIWFCKDEPYRNQVLRIKIKFRWYLWLHFDLQRQPGPAANAALKEPESARPSSNFSIPFLMLQNVHSVRR